MLAEGTSANGTRHGAAKGSLADAGEADAKEADAKEADAKETDAKETDAKETGGTAASSSLQIAPLDPAMGLRRLACDAIKRAITAMDIYGLPDEIKLDERRLSRDLGVSRTPVREALGYLEQEGFVRSVPRRGVFVVRKTKRELLDMILVWASIESMAARLATARATDAELHGLRDLFAAFEADPSAHLSEYSQANMAFHKAIIRMGGCELMSTLTDGIFIHMRAVRAVTLGQDNRAQRSLADHMAIIEALEQRDPDRAERLVREHTLGLAAHVDKHGDTLEPRSTPVPAGASRPARRRPAAAIGAQPAS